MAEPTKKGIAFEDLMYLSKQDAIHKYGTPHFYEQFILNGLQNRFRIGLNNVFTKEELASKSVLIDEVTWEKDKDTWVTTWYQITETEAIPKNTCVWKKGTDFFYLNSK
ncbi:MAG: hypothetical protein ACPGTO_03110 [Polaribacter sp.]